MTVPIFLPKTLRDSKLQFHAPKKFFLPAFINMDTTQLRKALNELPPSSLISEISEVQNTIAHLLKSNQEMREFNEEQNDLDLIQAIQENQDLIQRKEKQVNLTLAVIRERLGEAAWREVGSNIKEFREQHAQQLQTEKKREEKEENGVYL